MEEIEEKRILEFEHKLLEAAQYKWERVCPTITVDQRSLFINAFACNINIFQFYKLYLEKGTYPKDRLTELVNLLFDIKIQLFFIMEVDFEQYNQFSYNLGFEKIAIAECPYKALSRLSSDQTYIIKTRILWERVMNFIYYLEKGEKPHKYKSTKEKFLKLTKEQGSKWSFLSQYEKYIRWYDDALRGHEVHYDSILRKLFQQGLYSDNNTKMMHGLNGIVLNLWSNILKVVQGETPTWGLTTINIESE